MQKSKEGKPVQPPAGNSQGEAARWFGDLDALDFEIQIFERILARSPDHVSVLRALGESLARQGLWQRSLEVVERLIALRPSDGIAHYNLACSLAMQGFQSQAIDALARAIELGYRDFGHLEIDPDLESLRHLPAYRALVRPYRAARASNND